MAENLKRKHDLSFQYIEQNKTMHSTPTNMPIHPPVTFRPNTLPIDRPYVNNRPLFTPNDYNALSLTTPELDSQLRGFTTPDLINALSMPMTQDEQPSSGIDMLDNIFINHIDSDIRPVLSSTNQYNPSACQIVSDGDQVKQETISLYDLDQHNSQLSSYNHSVSSFGMDNESSNSTEDSSPSSTSQDTKQKKVGLQNVPSSSSSSRGKGHDEHHDLIRKEKKRERNRQAAQKCRTRKLTRIAELQKRVTELQGKNRDLSSTAECLKSDITSLEKKLRDHHTQGCVLMNGSLL